MEELGSVMHITPSSGHTIQAPHIEDPVHRYRVEWTSPLRTTAVLGVLWEQCTRWCWVLATTTDGALKVARYHYHSGTDFIIDIDRKHQ